MILRASTVEKAETPLSGFVKENGFKQYSVLAFRLSLVYIAPMGKVMVYIVHDPEADEGIGQVLSEMDIDPYSRFRDSLEEAAGGSPNAYAKRKAPPPHHVTIAVIEEGEKGRLLQRLKQLQVDRPFAGLRAFVVSVLDTI